MLSRGRRAGLLLAGAATLALAAAATAGEVNPALKQRCQEAVKISTEAEKNFLGKAWDWLGGAAKGTASTVGDRFTVSGSKGPYLCGKEGAEQTAAFRARRAKAQAEAKAGPVKSKGLNLAAQADVSGRLRPTLFHMPQTQARLQRIVDNLARAWPYPNAIDGPVVVLIDAHLGYNAEARADNTIVVWLGVLADPETGVSTALTDADLYWLLGHEYAHLALGHMQSDEMGESQRRFLHGMTTLAKRGAMLDSSINYAQTAPGAETPDLKEAYRDAREGQQGLRYVMDHLVYPAWGRMQEDQADVTGMDLAYLAGVPPRTSHSVQQFAATEVALEKRIEGVQANMTARAKKVMDDPRYKAALDQGDFGGAFGMVVKVLEKGLYEGLRKWFTETFSREHRSAANRNDGLSRYKKAAYTQAGLLPPNPEPVDGITEEMLKLPELASGIATARMVRAAELSLEALPTDKAGAAKAIAPALKGPFAGESYVRFVAHRVSLAHDRPAEAIAHLEVGVRSKHPSPESFRELVRLYAKARQFDKARQTIARGRAAIKSDSDYFLPSDIRVQIGLRQYDAAEKTLEACRATGREQIMLDCQAATLDGDYKNLSEKDKARLAELALWGEDPKAGATKGRGPSLPGKLEKIPMPWKRGR